MVVVVEEVVREPMGNEVSIGKPGINDLREKEGKERRAKVR